MQLLTGFCLGCLTLLFFIVIRDYWRFVAARVMAVLLAVGAAYLAAPYMDARFQWIAWNISSALPVLFWLMCQFGFSLKPRISAFWVSIALYSISVPLVASYSGEIPEEISFLTLVTSDIPKYLEYLLILNGLSTLFISWKGSILQCSTMLRLVFLLSLGVTGIWFSSSRNPDGFTSEALLVAICFCSVFSGVILLKGREDILGQLHVPEIVSAEVVLPQEARNVEATRRLVDIMDAGFYRTENLTIKLLSKKTQVPEYKIRILVNTSFGYRNFNDYVNHLRIRDAGERLLTETETPIRNISSDVGYRTLSSFNRAFKDIYLITPTEFRLSRDTADRDQSQLVSIT